MNLSNVDPSRNELIELSDNVYDIGNDINQEYDDMVADLEENNPQLDRDHLEKIMSLCTELELKCKDLIKESDSLYNGCDNILDVIPEGD